jgi:hypothetical protein
MAKVSGPFLSIAASGTVSKLITASRWKGIPYMREWFKPQNPRTQEQVKQRTRLTKAVYSWHQEDDTTKQAWEQQAQGKAVSGFNLYVRAYIQYMLNNNDQEPQRPFLP